jgi:hypothetical protein
VLRISSAFNPHISLPAFSDTLMSAVRTGRRFTRSFIAMPTLSIPKFTLLISIALLAGMDIQSILILLNVTSFLINDE